MMQPNDENIKCKSTKRNRPKTPVDVDDFPSVCTEDIFNAKDEIPFSVFTIPHDDLSTLANDTIGHTVYSGNASDDISKRWVSRQQRKWMENDKDFHAPSTSDSDIIFEVKEWPKLDSITDENETPKIADDAVFSLHKMPTTHGIDPNEFQQDIVFHETDACEVDLRQRGHCVVLAILGTFVSALLIGFVSAFLLSGEGPRGHKANGANVQENGTYSARPSPSPVMPMIPTVAPSVMAPHSDLDQVSQRPWSAGTTIPTKAWPSAHPTNSFVTQQPVTTQYSTTMPTSATTQSRNPSLIAFPTDTPSGRPSLGSAFSGAQEDFLGLLQSNASSEEYLKPFYNVDPSNSLSSSPQWQALEWLTADPNYYTYGDERKIQRYALAVFGFGLESLPDDETWLNYNIHECDWFTTAASGSSCPSNQNNKNNLRRGKLDDLVQRLELDNLGLVGTLPVELGLLSNTLTEIYLRNNSLSGTLPSVWGKDFQQLQRIQLTNAKLEGTLPPEWGQMRSLSVLGLGRNHLNGSLPEDWAMNGGMPSLGTLGLESNELTGTIPTDWGNGGMPSLIRLYLNKNSLTGQVPDSLWSPNAWLEVNLAANDLTGVISESTCAISTMTTLVADCNSGYVICQCCTVCV